MALDFTNTHIVAWRAHDPAFERLTNCMDYFIPDGMPLIWGLNAQGAGLKDRVYGPTFMRECLRSSPAFARHYFLGGSEVCLQELLKNVRALNPNLTIAGARNGYFKPEETSEVLENMRSARPDLIWVGLGTPKQQEFIAAHKKAVGRGIWLAVGFAFDVNAGTKVDAPQWMQRLGITWLYRVLQEPRRLLPRYIKFNSLFLYYTLLDRVLGITPKPSDGPRPGKTRIAFLGCRGVPARYSGFETLVEELGARLAERGHAVTVYNRAHLYPDRPREVRGMKVAYLPSLRTKSTETITHTLLAVIHAAVRKFDVVYLCGVGNSILAGILKLAGSRVIVNVDGDDFRRQKWHPLARAWLKWSELWATKLSDVVIADNQTVVERYRRDYGFEATYLSYGTPEKPKEVGKGALEMFGLKAREYVLYVGRLTPENLVDLLVRAYGEVKADWPCVVVGPAGYEVDYGIKLHRLAGPRVKLVGPMYGKGYEELSANCGIFVLPGVVEATRLVLLDQMGFGSAIVYHDCPATREVIGEAGLAFGGVDPEKDLAEKLSGLIESSGERERLRKAARERAEKNYNWEKVTDRYEEILKELAPTKK
jgi:exopolysaccharide biosynthesis WecB/TagA/CpsF family protein